MYQQLVRASSDSPDYDALSQTVKMTMRMLILSTWKEGSSAYLLYLHFASIGHIQLDDLDVFQRVVMQEGVGEAGLRPSQVDPHRYFDEVVLTGVNESRSQ